ncbi:DUF3800 domain-containing protein [Sphingomonas sp. R647]|uniref:DUF3800 domain-containing protein n=1 Tax=Sphingomonas sp. R647 TaxID=2875233 RepID=UPI001CD31CE2|nr:DUF3800 domain-containing protein [Sphingomonas sp. R647]MCA1199142.1 DUF3800 domain-containing protein [Sphingomonas sp. R647]
MGLICYLDDSDNDKGPVIVLGGYVTLAERWRAFEEEADRYMKSWGIEVLHTKDFQYRKGVHRGWPDAKRTAFIEGLFWIAGRYGMLGIYASANKLDASALLKQTPGLQNMSPIGLCFGSIITGIILKRRPIPAALPLTFIVEDGHRNNGNIANYFDWFRRNSEDAAKDLGSLKFVRKDDSRAIQLADFLAFYGRKSAEEADRAGYPPKWPTNPTLTQIRRHVPHQYERIFGTRFSPLSPGENLVDESGLLKSIFFKPGRRGI